MTDYKQPIRNVNTISENTKRILASIQNQIKPVENTINSLDTPSLPKGILLKEAKGYVHQGMGLYKNSFDTSDYGKIWVRKTFTNEKTGEKEDWLVVYEDDSPDRNIIRQVASEYIQKTAATPNPKDIPIAPGIKSKDLKLNESGGAGTGTVTIEFTDTEKALDFYQNEVTSPSGEKQAPKEEGEEPKQQETKQQNPPPLQPIQPQVQQAASLNKNAFDDFEPIQTNDLTSDNRAEDQFGQHLYVGDRVKGEDDRRGEITSVLDNGDVRVKWDETRGDFESYEGDEEKLDTFELKEAISIVPAFTLTKWASQESTVFDFSDGVKGVKVIKQASKTVITKHPWETLLAQSLGKTASSNDNFSFINEKGDEISLSLRGNIKIGEMFERPDNHSLVRFAGFIEKVAEDKPEEIKSKEFSLKFADEDASLDIHIETDQETIEDVFDRLLSGIEGDKLEGG
jgi:hypothetical protein